MKQQDRIAKAYRGLTADQLAALAFHYMTDANEIEFKRVASAVPFKDYRCPDVDYQGKLDNLSWLAAHWAIEYWRLRCRKSEKLGGALAALHRGGDDERADDLLDAHEQAEQCLLALDAALDVICQGKGIDPADVRRMAGAEPFKARREDTEPDTEIQAQMETAFAQLLAG
jgi:hypothetical protein